MGTAKHCEITDDTVYRFHSINVPSEWGRYAKFIRVSIQLMSPASGDQHDRVDDTDNDSAVVSIQLMSPASGDK